MTESPISPGLAPRPADATTGLTAFLVLLLAVPSVLRLPALGGVGYPAAMFAFVLGLWWCWSSLRGLTHGGPINPVKVGLFSFLAAVVCSYGWAMRRAIPPIESSQANIGVLRILVFVSVVLICCDGIPTWDRFLTAVRRIAVGGGLFALLGLLQFFTNRSLIGWIVIPGFSAAQESGVIVRSGFTRASATAIHPLEYAAALSVVFPIALTLALNDKTRGMLVRWLPAVFIALALVLSGSRSGYLGLVVGVLVLAFGWSRQVLAAMAAAGVALLVVVFVTVPGMIGTIRGLFLSAGTDSSATSRSNSYGLVEEFFARSPALGRGFGTFLPTYRILDNQILLLLVETGLLGLLTFVALGVLASGSALLSRRRYGRGLPRQLGQAVCAATLASMTLMFFFDALGFPISGGMLAVSIGMCGAYYRLARSLPDVVGRPLLASTAGSQLARADLASHPGTSPREPGLDTAV